MVQHQATVSWEMVMRRAIRAAASEQGAEIVEFALVILPLFGFVFLLFSISWMLFAQASLQYAVREGCRYAATSSLTSQAIQNTKNVVQQSSFGFLTSTELDDISITSPSSAGIITVTATKAIPIIGGSFFNANSITLSASSSDAVESP